MNLFATLQQSTTWTQKQLIGLVVIGGILLVVGIRAVKNRGWLVAAAVVAVLFWFSRGVGHGGP
jgi:hypothetical protein